MCDISSCTGHNDVLMGCLCTNDDELADKISFLQHSKNGNYEACFSFSLPLPLPLLSLSSPSTPSSSLSLPLLCPSLSVHDVISLGDSCFMLVNGIYFISITEIFIMPHLSNLSCLGYDKYKYVYMCCVDYLTNNNIVSVYTLQIARDSVLGNQ